MINYLEKIRSLADSLQPELTEINEETGTKLKTKEGGPMIDINQLGYDDATCGLDVRNVHQDHLKNYLKGYEEGLAEQIEWAKENYSQFMENHYWPVMPASIREDL